MNNLKQPPKKPNNSNSSLIDALKKIMQKTTAFQRAVVGVGILVVFLVISFVTFNPSDNNLLVVVLGLIILTFIIATIASVHSSDRQITSSNDGRAKMDNNNCETIRRRLNAARKILNALEERAAKYPTGDMPALLVVDLDDKRNEVTELESELKKCLGGIK
jgi:hypothetical protein